MNSFPSPCDSSRSFFLEAQPVWKKGNVLYIKTVRLGLAGKRRSERQFHRLSPQGCLAS